MKPAPRRARVPSAVLIALLLAPGCALLRGGGAGDGDGSAAQAWLEDTIHAHTQNPQGRGGVVEFEYASVRMACVSDANADRMRIIAPIRNLKDVGPGQFQIAMEANFHTALDARYATSRGILYAAYLHPLRSLDERQLLSALEQVSQLARSFGTTYSSGEWTYDRGN